jgi:scyllo-inositol 2-dehydrogenase (NADP+)
MKQFNVGIIGYGLSGKYLQAPFFDHHQGFYLHSIVTKNGNPKDDFPFVYHVYEADDIIYHKDIDLISICSPNPTHYQIAKKCLEEGKHILVEKPLVATLAEAKELYELAESKGLHVFVYQNRRFDSDFLTISKIIGSGQLGRLVTLDINFHRYKPVLNPKKWKEVSDPSNGIMYDLGSHILDQAIALFGRPSHWYGQTFTQREGSVIDDAFMIWLDYLDIKVCLRSSMLMVLDQPRYLIVGTEGTSSKYGIDVQEDHLKEGMKVNNPAFGMENEENSAIIGNSNGQYTIPTEKGNWMNLFENLYQVLLGNEQVIITKEQVLIQIEILESIKSTKQQGEDQND